MKKYMLRILPIILLASFFICYIDFGHGGGTFAGQWEVSILTSLQEISGSIIMLLAVIMMLGGQIALIVAAIKPNTGVSLGVWGAIMLGVIVIINLLFGIFTPQISAIASTLPFILLAVIYIIKLYKHDKVAAQNNAVD